MYSLSNRKQSSVEGPIWGWWHWKNSEWKTDLNLVSHSIFCSLNKSIKSIVTLNEWFICHQEGMNKGELALKSWPKFSWDPSLSKTKVLHQFFQTTTYYFFGPTLLEPHHKIVGASNFQNQRINLELGYQVGETNKKARNFFVSWFLLFTWVFGTQLEFSWWWWWCAVRTKGCPFLLPPQAKKISYIAQEFA